MTHLFFRDHDQTKARFLSRSTAFHIGLLFGPTALLLALLRLLEHSMLKTAGMRTVTTVLWEAGAPPFIVLFLTVTLGWIAHQAWPYVRPAWMMTGVVILGIGLALWTKILIPAWLAGWVSAEAFQVLRSDLLMLLGLALLFTALLEFFQGWMRRVALVVAHLLIPLLLLLPIFELGTILAMGSPPDWSLLSYSIRHIGELAPVIASEVDGFRALLLLLPFIITLLPLGLARLPAIRRWIDAAAAPALRPAWPAVLVPVPLTLLLLLPPATALPPTHNTISYTGMMKSMLVEDNFEPEELAGLTNTAALPFDTKDLRFVPTDNMHRFNVVIIILESSRARSLTPYNPDLATTPFLDDLARRSLLVENMHGIVSYTNKSLVPILAGVYPELSREIIEAEPDAVPAAGLPTLLQPHGYRTAFFTPATVAYENKDQILKNLGFEEIYGDASFDKEGFFVTNYFGYEDRVMLEPSMAWVDEVSAQNRPFFLSYLTLSAHHAYQIPPTFPQKIFDPAVPQINDYLNSLHYTDAFVKDLFDAFEQRGLIDSTLFVLLGDHGEAFGEHGERTHGDVIWDEAIHIPALVHNPVLFPEARRVAGNRSQIDVMPTIADALGFRIANGSYPGISLLDPAPTGRLVYHSARDGNLALAMRQDSLKFFYYNRRKAMQVFNTYKDPLERIDIAPLIDPNLLKSAEINLLLWRRGVQKVYHPPADEPEQLAVQ